MNSWEEKIRKAESEIHKGLFTLHKDKTKSPKPDVKGYMDEDLMLSDYMVWLFNTHIDEEIRATIFHIENEGNFGGNFGSMQGAISKGKGKRKGILDVESVYLGIMNWIEFKLISGTFSKEQLNFISLLLKWKKPVFIIRDFDFFKFVVEEIIFKGIDLSLVGGGVFKSIEQIKIKLANS